MSIKDTSFIFTIIDEKIKILGMINTCDAHIISKINFSTSLGCYVEPYWAISVEYTKKQAERFYNKYIKAEK